MLRKKTCFVVGAGAGISANFPSGKELLENIWSSAHAFFLLGRLDEERTRDTDFAYSLQWAVKNGILNEEIAKRRFDIIDSLKSMQSIDDFVDSRQDEDIAKFAKFSICYHIGIAEKRSTIFRDQDEKIRFDDKLYGGWPLYLWQTLHRGHTLHTINEIFSNSYFIVFNYDRFVEEYLYQALRAAYNLDQDAAFKLIRKLNIVHPYGAIGGGHPAFSEVNKSVAFGGCVNSRDICNSIDEILTYTESVASEKTELISSYMRESESIVFLGFGYHDQNLRLIKPEIQQREVFGTALGNSKYTLSVLGEILKQKFSAGGEVYLHNGTCESFFDEYRLGLMHYEI